MIFLYYSQQTCLIMSVLSPWKHDGKKKKISLVANTIFFYLSTTAGIWINFWIRSRVCSCSSLYTPGCGTPGLRSPSCQGRGVPHCPVPLNLTPCFPSEGIWAGLEHPGLHPKRRQLEKRGQAHQTTLSIHST